MEDHAVGPELLELIDTLVEGRATVQDFLRTVAIAIPATIGFEPRGRASVAFDASGEISRLPLTEAISRDIPHLGRVWVLRSDARSVNDVLLLRRLSVALVALVAMDDARIARGDPLGRLVDPSLSERQRIAELERLGLNHQAVIRIIVSIGPPDKKERFLAGLRPREGVVRSAEIDGRTVTLLRTRCSEPFTAEVVPTGLRAAQSHTYAATEIPTALRNANGVLRFGLPSAKEHGPYSSFQNPFPVAEQVGAFEALTMLSREQLSQIDDLRRLDGAIAELGPDLLTWLEAYASTESVRQAAALVNMHHNTLSEWIRKAEHALGFELSGRYRRARLLVTLCLYRVRSNLDL